MNLREQVFRKMGWEQGSSTPDGEGMLVWYLGMFPPAQILEGLPPIDSQWEVTAKYLVPFMREKGWLYEIRMDGQGNIAFAWQDNIDEGATEYIYAEVKDDNLAEAACRAFMEVEL